MQGKPIILEGATVYEVVRQKQNITYNIMVYVPPKTELRPKKGWPVYFVLDGNATFISTIELMRVEGENTAKSNIAPGVVVGLSEKSADPFPQSRSYDFTTFAKPETMENWFKNRNIDVFASGGATEFLSFLAEEVQPFIYTLAPINRKRQTLMGHSLAGFFALYVLLEQPELFQRYIIASPSLWWNGGEILAELPATPIKGEVLVTVGGDEPYKMKQDAQHLTEQLELHSKKISYIEFPSENHGTVLLKDLRLMLKNI